MGPVLRGMYPHVPPLAVAFFRIGGVALAAWGLARWKKLAWPSREDWPALFGLSLLGISCNQLFFLIGISMTSAITGMVLITLIPVFTYAVAMVMRQETWLWRRVAGVGLALAGAVWLVVSRSGGLVQVSAWGGGLIVLNGFMYAWFLVLSRRFLAKYSAYSVMALVFIFGGVVVVPLTVPVVIQLEWSVIPGWVWMGLFYIMVGPTLIAYIFNAWAQEKGLSASTVAVYIYLQPFVAALIAIPWLGEQVTSVMAGSALLIFSGIAMTTRSP